jgi:hypothetical protein
LARLALTDPDPGARETWANDAPGAQERWRCSAVLDDCRRPVYGRHESLDTLDSECRGIVEEIAALTGIESCADCPMATTRAENNEWLNAVTRAYRDHEKGSLASRHANPDAVLMDAIDCLGSAIDARLAHDAEEFRKRMEASTEKHPGKEVDTDD